MSRRPILAMTSDWHLQLGAWKRANTPKGDSFFALRQIYQFCVERGVDLLGAGDLFDDLKPETFVLQQAFRFADDMQRAGRKIFFTQGQHEKASPPYLSLHPYPVHVHRRPIGVRGLTIYGIDHVPADRLESEVEDIPTGVDVLLCHQVWAEFMGVGAEGRLAMLNKPGGARVVLTGDYHVHRVLDVEGVQVCSPGSTCLQSINEPDEKAFFLLYDDLSFESVPLVTRPTIRRTVRTDADVEEVLAGLGGPFLESEGLPLEMQKPILYVEAAEIDQAYSRIARAAGDKVFLFWKSLVGKPGDVLYEEREALRSAPCGLEACLPLVVPAGGSVYNSVLRLLRAADKKKELDLMAREFGRS